MRWRGLKSFFFGRPLPSQRLHSERLSKSAALAVLSSDALSSVAYATEQLLLVLVVAGIAGLHHALSVAGAIVILMSLVVASYRQTVLAYPQGGGAYFVARENLGISFGLVAAAALLVDYVLTVTVSVASGVDAITSAFPATLQHRVAMGVLAIAIIAFGNLRGIRESAAVFSVPTYLFIGMFGLMLLLDLVHPFGYWAPAARAGVAGAQPVTLWLLLTAFASGCSALTGVEAISNGVPVFRPPESKNAATVMLWMGLILGAFFAGTSLVANRHGVLPVGDQTVISQLGHGAFGNSPLYFLLQVATALILILAANTAFADFPRLASILGQDRYLPRQLANRGDRLVFSNGILMLALVAGLLLVLFRGETSALIHLYAVGVFVSFTLSQAGMVRRTVRERGPRWPTRAMVSAVGAGATGIVVIIELVTKFIEGAWISAFLIGLLVVVFYAIQRHYVRFGGQLAIAEWQPIIPRKHIVIVPVAGVSKSSQDALAYALLLSQNVYAVAVAADPEQAARLEESWDRWDSGVPLKVLRSPFRSIVRPLLDYIERVEKAEQPDWLTVVLPEVVPARWWHAFLHNQAVYAIKTALLFRRNVVVTTVRYHLTA